MPLVRALQQLGMPLYMCQPPTGYKDTADAWVNTGALVNRMNFALALAERPACAGVTRRSTDGQPRRALVARRRRVGRDARDDRKATTRRRRSR